MDQNEITFDISGEFLPFCRIRMLYKNIPVGYCNLIKDENTVKIADIFIYNRKEPIARFLPFIKIGVNYRRRGFGTLLLEKAINLCKEIKVSRIVGQAQGELDILIPWYRKHGFEHDIHDNLLLKFRETDT